VGKVRDELQFFRHGGVISTTEGGRVAGVANAPVSP